MTSPDDTTVYRLDIEVLKGGVFDPKRKFSLVDPYGFLFMEEKALSPIGLVYDRIIISTFTSTCLFRITVVGVMFVCILNRTMFNCLKRDKFHYAVCQTLKKDIFLFEKTVNIFAFIYLQVCVPVHDLASDE